MSNIKYDNEDTGEQCCGQCFVFKWEDLKKVANLRFYSAGGKIIIVTYEKDGRLYVSVSFDCGQSFLEPRIAIQEIGGSIKDIQIAAKDNQFVIALMINDAESLKDIKKAVSGTIESGKVDFSCKECVKHQVKGKLINIAVGFRPWYDPDKKKIDGEESVDFSYYFDNGRICLDCNGHMCLIK